MTARLGLIHLAPHVHGPLPTVSLTPGCRPTLTPFVAAEMSHKQMFASSEPLRRCPSVKGFQARP